MESKDVQGGMDWGRPQRQLVLYAHVNITHTAFALSVILVRLARQLVLVRMHRETLTFGGQLRCP